MRRQPHTSPSPHTSQRYEKASEKYQVYLDISYCERKYLRVHLKDCNQKGRKHIKEKVLKSLSEPLYTLRDSNPGPID